MLDASANGVGIGTTAPVGAFQVKGNEVRIGDGTVDTATGNGDLYVADDLEVDGVLYGNGAGLTSIPASSMEAPGSNLRIPFNSSGSWSSSANLIWNGSAGTGGSLLPQRVRTQVDGSTSTPSYSFESDTNSGLYSAGADELAFTVGGTRTITFEVGQVGVMNINPAHPLDVTGVTASTSFRGDNGSAAAVSYGFAGDVQSGMYHPANNTLGFATNATARIRIAPDGNVGIGTTSPAAKLQVNGDLQVDQTLVFDQLNNNTSATNVTVDWSIANKQKITMGHNVTFAFTAPPGVASLTLFLYQDGTGSRTATWPATVKWPSDTAPTLTTTAGDLDIISCTYDGSTNYYCQAGIGFNP